jgi:hypothetical protein
MAKLLGLKASYACISEYENGVREPNLIVLLRYAKAAKISTDVLIDDDAEIRPWTLAALKIFIASGFEFYLEIRTESIRCEGWNRP